MLDGDGRWSQFTELGIGNCRASRFIPQLVTHLFVAFVCFFLLLLLLLMLLLLLVLSLLLLSLLLLLLSVAVLATHLTFAFLWAHKNRHRVGVFAIFLDTLGPKAP